MNRREFLKTTIAGLAAAAAPSLALGGSSGLLYEYPGAAKAFSTRQLSRGYSGPLYRVSITDKEGIELGQADIYPDMDVDALLDQYPDAYNVYSTVAYDQSGNGNDSVVFHQ